MSIRRLSLALALFLSAAPLRAQDAQQPSSTLVRTGDVLRLRMWPDQAFSGDYPVEATGQVFLPLLGEVQAGGRPLAAIRAELQNRYRGLVQNSTVAASVVFRISVLGSVLRPGLYHVDPSTTVLDAISMAGGLRDDADGDKLRILRRDRSIDLHAARALAGDQAELAQQLESGDRIIVPAREDSGISAQGVLSIIQTAASLTILLLQLRK